MKPKILLPLSCAFFLLIANENLLAQIDTLNKNIRVDPKLIQKNQPVLKPVTVINQPVSPVANKTVVYVKWDATGLNNGTSWANAFTNLQNALTAAVSGKKIWIARGTYKPTATLDRTANFRLKENVSILGGFAGTESLASMRSWRRNPTILDGDIGMTGIDRDNSYNLIYAERISSATVIDGLFLKNANANRDIATSLTSAGGAIYIEGAANTNPIFRNCEISDNRAFWGAGVSIFDSELIRVLPGGANPLFDSCTFRNNTSVHSGGAVYIHALKHSINPRFVNCFFENNRANNVGGGAVYHSVIRTSSSPVFEGCLFRDNISNGGATVQHALGSSRREDWPRLGESNPTYTRCKFQYSGPLTISFGQGVIRIATYGRAYTINVKECVFEYTGRSTDTYTTHLGWTGGAFYNWANISSQLNLKVTNSIFRKLQVNGHGGVLYNYASLQGKIRNDFTNCLFVQNYGCKGGVMYSSTSGDSTQVVSNFYNSIFYYNYFQSDPDCGEGEDVMLNTTNTSAALFNCLTNKSDCDVMRGGPGRITCTGMIFATDPMFVDYVGGNYNLQPASPAIDAGNDSYITSITTDILGNIRRSGVRVDIGPYEVRR